MTKRDAPNPDGSGPDESGPDESGPAGSGQAGSDTDESSADRPDRMTVNTSMPDTTSEDQSSPLDDAASDTTAPEATLTRRLDDRAEADFDDDLDDHGTHTDDSGSDDLDDDGEIEPPTPPTISVDLPAQVHSMPEDEIAVAIVDVPIDPSGIHGAQPTTTSIAITVVPAIADPVSAATASTTIVPLSGRHGDLEHGDDSAETTYSRRDRLRGATPNTPEPAAMLTAERLLGGGKKQRGRPEGRWPEFVFTTTFGSVNLGDSKAARERKLVDARIRNTFVGGTRFVPVLTRKGGVGKTTVTTLLGMAMADARDDRIIAIDANPDRGTLAERVSKQTRATVRDVVTRAPAVTSFADFTNLVSRDETRLDILASDTDPLLSEAFKEDDYNVVADLCARFYSIALTDCGTGIVHSVMRATLQRADSVVIVSGGSVDEARLASETLTWLEANGYSDLVKNAVVALNTATQGTTLVKLEEVEAHFRSRVREIVRIPYDPQLAAGSVVTWKYLKPLTRSAARELAALVVDGLPPVRSS